AARVVQGAAGDRLHRPHPAHRAWKDRSRCARRCGTRPAAPITVWYIPVPHECVETARARPRWGRPNPVARVSSNQSANRREAVPPRMGAGAAAEQPRTNEAATRLAAHDRLALPDLRA